jgi:ribosome maturation factor RimP
MAVAFDRRYAYLPAHPDIVATRWGWRRKGPARKAFARQVSIGDPVADIARLTEVIEPEAIALGFELVRVKLSGAGDERTLQVMAEDPATGQLVVDQCMALSRRISDRIDAIEEAGEELVHGAYNLEVSSPGIDRPLTRAKDYANWAGHEVNISLNEPVGEHRKLRGELIEIIDKTVVVEDRKAGRVEVPLQSIHSAKLVLTDKLLAATRPLDTSGVEEHEEAPEEEAQD